MISEHKTEGTNHFDSLPKILAREYFSKPVHAVAKFCDIAAHDSVKLDFKHPALDLGCGIGAFGSVFCKFNGLDGLDFGTDFRIKNIQQASRRNLYKMVFQSDARALPIKSGTLKFILCNGVLYGISPGHDLALREVARVLQTDGQFLMTVPTPNFTAVLLPTRLFEKLGVRTLSTLYCRRVNVRQGIRKSRDLQSWRRELEQAGLRIEKCVSYFAGREATWCSVLNMRPFQLCAILRYLPGFVQRLAAALTEKLVRCIPKSGYPAHEQCGYVLICARKM